jgi:CRISPR-associated protein Csm2
VTTSKIRNLLAISADIFNEVRLSREDKLSDEVLGRINYLKIRFFYEAGRDKDGSVRAFLEEAEIVECINEIGNSKTKYLLFNRYMEALIAYHKFYGGKD